MKSSCVKGSLFVVVTVLLVGVSSAVFAATSSDTVNVTITVNMKYELEVISGSVVSGVLDPHTITVLGPETVGDDGTYETMIRVKTNSKSWVIQAQVTSDTMGFLDKTDFDPDGSYTGTIEVSTAGVEGTWYAVPLAAAVNITNEQTSPGGNQQFTVNYRITTTWLHEAGTSYPMTITYTVTSYNQ